MRRASRAQQVRLLGTIRRRRSALLLSTALQATAMLVLSLPADAQPAPNAQPRGGVVVAGSAAISQTTGNTSINQSTQRAAIDWKSFNVGSQQSVTFNQPSASAVTLNRVTGPDPSQIAGRIDANGQVVLVNQSGVTFYKGAQVNASGLLVTASGISNQNFMAGAMKFDQPGHPNAKVENQGNITISQAGLAALVAPQVANSGTISARLGHVVLAGAKTATLDMYGDGLLSLDVSNQVTQTPRDSNGNAATALVTNTGVIVADGGTVQLTARAADGVVQNLVRAGGRIRAATMGDQTGVVALNGVGGSIVVEGQLSAPGYTPGTKGGNIEVATNGNVGIASTAKINASGKAGGGNIGIGTSLDRVKGGPSVMPAVVAANTTVSKGATIKANARDRGDGGRVTVLSSGTTVMDASISATGGSMGGDGGFIETSGTGFLFVGPSASVTAAAPQGKGGNWLLDPDSDIDILGASLNAACAAGTCGPTSDTSTLDAATIATALNGGTSVIVTTSNPAGTQFGNITVDSQIALTAAQTVSLTLDAGAGGGFGAITINQPITDAGSTGALSLELRAGGGINFFVPVILGGGLTVTAGIRRSGDITQGALGNLTVRGLASFTNQSSDGLITLNTSLIENRLRGGVAFSTTGTNGNVVLTNNSGASGTVLGASTVKGSFSVTDTSGSISQSGTLIATGAASFQTTASNQTITLNTTTNALTGGVTFTTNRAGGDVSLRNSGGTDLRGLDVGGTFSLEDTTGSITQFATPLKVGGTASFKTGGSGQTITLTDPGNAFAGVVTFNTTGSGADATFVNSVDTTLGASAIGGKFTVNDIGTLTIGDTLAVGGTASLTAGKIVLGTAADIAAPTIMLTGSTGISLLGSAVLGQAGSVVDLNTAGGDVIEAGTALIAAGTLLSSNNIAGKANLIGDNKIAAIGTLHATGDIVITDGGQLGTLAVSGPLTGANVALSGAPTLNVTGSIGAIGTVSLAAVAIDLAAGAVLTGPTVKLSAGGGGIALTGNASLGQGGGIVDINSAGTISEATTSVITAGTLLSGLGVSGNVSLLGVANAIATLGNIPLSPSVAFALRDASALTVGGTIQVTGIGTQLYLRSSDAGGITIGSGGLLKADAASGLVSLQADVLTNGGSISAATVEIAPNTAGGALTLGSGGLSLSGIGAGNLVVGAVTPPGGSPTTTAGSITIGSGGFDTTGVSTVTLDASGAVTQIGALTGDSQVLGTAGSFTLLNKGNKFASIGLTATAGDIQIVDATSVSVAANAASGNFYLAAPAVTLTGAVSAAGILGLQTDSFTVVSGSLTGTTVELAPLTTGITETLGAPGGLSLLSDAFITGNLRIGAITIPGSALTTTAGSIVVGGSFGSAGRVLELDSLGGISESLGATLTADTLTGHATSVSLTQPGNLIATLGSFSTTSGFALVDNEALTVDGPLTDTGVASTLSLTTTTGGITLTGTVSAANILNLVSADDICQCGGVVVAGTLTGSAVTSASLTQLDNLIGTLGAFSTGAGFELVNDQALVVAGPVTDIGAGSTLSITTKVGGITLGGTVSATDVLELISAGTISQSGGVLIAGTLTGSATAASFTQPGNLVGTLAAFSTSGGFALVDNEALTVTGPLVDTGVASTLSLTTTTGGITLDGTISATNILNLVSADDICQCSGTLIAGMLTGSAASSASFTEPDNHVGTLAAFSTGAGFALEDNQSLTVTGPVTDTSVFAGVALKANGDLTLAGTLSATYQLILEATGAINQTGGRLIAYSLSGKAASASLTQPLNLINTLDTFITTDGFALVDNRSLNVTGLLKDTGASSTLALTTNNAADGNLSLYGTVSGTNIVSLNAAGDICQCDGTLIAGTLTGSAGGGVTLTQLDNHVGTLGTFTTGAGFVLYDNQSLTVTGSVIDSSLCCGVALFATGDITLAGNISAAAGTVILDATGAINQTGGTLIADTLTGKAASASLTQPVNLVGTLDSFATSGGFALVDNRALTVTGPVIDTGAASTLSLTTTTGGITLAGDVGAINQVQLVSAGTISQPSGSLVANTLTASAVGDISLLSTSNGIVGSTGISSTGGDVALIDNVPTLTLTGSFTGKNLWLELAQTDGTLALGTAGLGATLTATSGASPRISLVADRISEGAAAGTIVASGGVVELAPFTAGYDASIGGAQPAGAGVLVLDSRLIGEIGSGTLVVGRFTDVANGSTLNTSAGTITVDGTVSLSGVTTLDLETTGNIDPLGTQAGAITNLATLIGRGGAVVLNNAGNTIATLGSFSTTSGFTLVDNQALTVAGPVTDTGAASKLSLTTKTGGIALTGTVTATNLLELIAAGSISQTSGTLIAGTLTGSAGGSASLAQSGNLIGTLGAFSTKGGFALVDNEALLVSGPVSDTGAATTLALTTKTGGITLGGNLSATNIVDLVSAGAISQIGGSLTAGTLTGSATSASITQATNLVGTLGAFSTSGGFALVDNQALLVAGPVTDTGAGSTLALTTKIGGITLGGNVSATNLVALVSAGAISQVGGSLTAGTLTGAAATSASLTAGNSIAVLGDFTAGSGFTLVDVSALSVSGAVNGGTSVVIADSAGITIPGSLAGTASVTLTSGGAISETGGISTALLTGSAATSASFTGTNAIATLGDFTAVSGFTLVDASAVSVSGTVNGGTSVSITDGAGISIPGSVSGSAGVTLISAGAISETGSISTGLLTGSAATSASLTGSNAIAALGDFTATTGITLIDASALTVSGAVNGGTSVAITDAAGISIPGSVSGATSVKLTSGGAISGTGSINTALLTGSAAAGASLTGSNLITTLGDFTASGVTLNDGTGLTVTGSVSGGPLVTLLDKGTLTIASGATVAATAISLTADSIAIPGKLTDGGSGSVSLIASTGSISETGTVIAGTLSGSAAGSANFSGANAAANQIVTVSNFTASGFSLNDAVSLTVSGGLQGGPGVTLVDKGTLAIASGGTVAASTIGLNANDIAIAGLLTDGGAGAVNLVATTGAISETGTLIAGSLSGSSALATRLVGASANANRIGALGNFTASSIVLNDGASLLIAGLVNGGASVVLNDTASISETGSLIASLLTGSAGGSANFTGANRIGALGNFSAQGFSLNDGTDLLVNGVVNGGPNVSLAAGNITMPGVLSGSSNVNLVANGGTITETGTIIAGSLSGSATGAANFDGASRSANQIASLGNFTAGNFTLSDGISLSVNGTVNGGASANIAVNGALTVNGLLLANSIGIDATGGIAIRGTVQDANSVSLISGASIDGTGGTLIADLLNGSAAGSVTLTGSGNQVLQLGSFTAGSFVLNDATDLLISGPLTAGYISINAGARQITFGNGATIVTGGFARPPGIVSNLPSASTSSSGAYLTSGGFIQLGDSFVVGLGGGPNILRIDVSGSGNISFDPAGGLHGPSTWLILGVDSGHATGNVAVASLDIARIGSTGSAELTGSVNGLTGPSAASAAGIRPSPSSNFRFNSCAVHSVNCVLLPTEGLPTANPLNDISIGGFINPDDQDDLLLPIVSDQDY